MIAGGNARAAASTPARTRSILMRGARDFALPRRVGQRYSPHASCRNVWPSMFLKRVRNVALAIVAFLAPFGVLMLSHVWLERAPLVFVSATVTRSGPPDGPTRSIELPYRTESEPDHAYYRYKASFRARGSPRGAVRIVPDDCLHSLVVNGQKVPLEKTIWGTVCDYNEGFVIDIGRFLHSGENQFELMVENKQGPHGLTIHSIRTAETSVLRSIGILVALVAACFVAVRRLPLRLSHQCIAAVLLALAGWIRYRYVFDWHAPEFFAYSDMSGYVKYGRELARGEHHPDQLIQPIGYPLILALSLRAVGDFALAYWVQVVAGWGTVVLTWRASAHRWLGERAGLWVLGIAALHIPFITLSGFFLAETVFAFQLALLFYGLSQFRFPWRSGQAFVLGLVYMSGLWIKGHNTFFGPVVMAWIVGWAIAHRRVGWKVLLRRLLAPALAFCVAAAVVVASHAAYTRVYYGHAHLSAATAALNLVEGKCPAKTNYDSTGSGWLSPLFVQLGENAEKRWPRPFSDQSYFWAAGLECIKENPVVLLTSIRYVYYLFFDNQLWPSNTTDSAGFVRASGMFYSALLFPGILACAAIVARRPWRRSGLFVVLALSIACVRVRLQERAPIPRSVRRGLHPDGRLRVELGRHAASREAAGRQAIEGAGLTEFPARRGPSATGSPRAIPSPVGHSLPLLRANDRTW